MLVSQLKKQKPNSKNKNQILVSNVKENKFSFYSYGSLIAIYKIDNGQEVLTVGKHYDYSNTTLKHLYMFINEVSEEFSYLLNYGTKSKTRAGKIKELILNNKIKYNAKMA